MRGIFRSAALAALLVLPASAAGALDGTVVSGTAARPVAGATIHVEASGVLKPDAATTTPDGRFRIDMAALFDARERDTFAVTLSFEADGYRPETRVINLPERGAFDEVTDLTIALISTGGGGSLSEAEADALNDLVAEDGYALFLLPFDGDQAGAPPGFDLERFARALRRSIVPHIQALPVADPPQDLSIRPITVDVGSSDAERIMAYGVHLKGLAMVTGEVYATPSAGGDQIELSSSFQIVPQVDGYGPGSLFVDDMVPAGSMSVRSLSERISPLWKMASVLAIGVHEYKQAMALSPADQAALRRVRAYLAAQKSGASADMHTFVRQLDRLIERIDGELTGS